MLTRNLIAAAALLLGLGAPALALAQRASVQPGTGSFSVPTVGHQRPDGRWEHVPIIADPIRRGVFNAAHAALSQRGWSEPGGTISGHKLSGRGEPPPGASTGALTSWVLGPIFRLTAPGFDGNFTRAVSRAPRALAAPQQR